MDELDGFDFLYTLLTTTGNYWCTYRVSTSPTVKDSQGNAIHLVFVRAGFDHALFEEYRLWLFMRFIEIVSTRPTSQPVFSYVKYNWKRANISSKLICKSEVINFIYENNRYKSFKCKEAEDIYTGEQHSKIKQKKILFYCAIISKSTIALAE